MRPQPLLFILASMVAGACDEARDAEAVAIATSAYDIDTDFIIKGEFQLRACGEGSDRLIRDSNSSFSLEWRNVVGNGPIAQTSQDGGRHKHIAWPARRDVGGGLITYKSWTGSVAQAQVFYCQRDAASACGGTTRRLGRTLQVTAPDQASEVSGGPADFRHSDLRPLRVDLVSPYDENDPTQNLIDSVLITIERTAPDGTQTASRFQSSTVDSNATTDPHAVNAFVRPSPGPGATTRTTSAGLLVFSEAGTYDFTYRITFANGDGTSSPALVLSESMTLDGDCNTPVVRSLNVARPSQRISGSMHFVPLASDVVANVGPRADKYYPEVRLLDTGSVIGTTPSGTQVEIPVAPGSVAAYVLDGIPSGRYAMRARGTAGGGGTPIRHFGTASLLWLPGPGYTYPASPFADHPALFRFPDVTDLMAPLSPLGQPAPWQGFDPDGTVLLSPNEIETLDRIATMAIFGGNVSLDGCLGTPNISGGTAEVNGLASGASSSYTDELGNVRSFDTGVAGALARGLFRIDTGSQPQYGDYEIAASRGTWEEGKYRLKLDANGYDGALIVRPATPQIHELVNGRGNASAQPRSFKTGKLRVTIQVRSPCSEQPSCPSDFLSFSQPELAIGGDFVGAEQPFYTTAPADWSTPGTPEGYYSATSRGASQSDTEHTVEIVGLVHSRPTIQYRALVQMPNADWSSFTPTWVSGVPFTYTFGDGSCNDCWVGGDSFTDDENPPAIGTVSASLGTLDNDVLLLPFGTTSLTISAALSDVAGVLLAGANGEGMTRVTGDDTSGIWSAFLTVDATTSAIVISATDKCGRVTTRTIQVDFEPGPCATPILEQCMEDEPGSVFYVALRGPTGQVCRLPCEVAAPGAAVTCNSSDIVCP